MRPPGLAIWAFAMSTIGCASGQLKPVMVSSAASPAYALNYPERLHGEVTSFDLNMQELVGPKQTKAPSLADLKPGADPEVLFVVVQQADYAGRTEAYAAAHDEFAGVDAFWDEERNAIAGRINGAAQKQVTEAGCTQQIELGGPINYTLKDGVDRQLAKRLRASNEAHRTIERHKAALGAGNVAAAQALADHIAFRSYLVNIALVEQRDRIQSLLAERSEVEDTLGDSIDWERAYQQSGHSPAEKKASQEQMAALEKARAAIPGLASNAEAKIRDLDPTIEELRKKHDAQIEAMLDELKAQQARAAK
jgi:hypothetical protein